jgi:hypothetical protein
MSFWFLLLLPLLGPTANEHVATSAAFKQPDKPGAQGAIAVTFSPIDPAVRVNEDPAPRLKLDPAQKVLVDKQTAKEGHAAPVDPELAHYLDPKVPVSFPVALAPGAPKGAQVVHATVTFFYCSKKEGWCRKGTSELNVPVTVP